MCVCVVTWRLGARRARASFFLAWPGRISNAGCGVEDMFNNSRVSRDFS